MQNLPAAASLKKNVNLWTVGQSCERGFGLTVLSTGDVCSGDDLRGEGLHGEKCGHLTAAHLVAPFAKGDKRVKVHTRKPLHSVGKRHRKEDVYGADRVRPVPILLNGGHLDFKWNTRTQRGCGWLDVKLSEIGEVVELEVSAKS